LRICPAYCRPTCGTPASELAELDGSNLDRSWIEFGGSDRFSGVALGYALIGADDDALDQFGDFTPAADNSAGADSDGLAGATVYDYTIGPGAHTVDGQTMYDANILNVLFADGNHVEIDTVPGEFTNFLDCTSIGCGDRTEAWGSTTPQLLYDSLTTAQFPSEVFNLADYLPPDAWFPDINGMFPPA